MRNAGTECWTMATNIITVSLNLKQAIQILKATLAYNKVVPLVLNPGPWTC